MSPSINRDWIASQFSKGIDAEQALRDEARARAEFPPGPALRALYHEIATADERHRATVEKVAIRYGYVPARSTGSGISEALGRLKEKVADSVMGSNPLGQVAEDLIAKANAIHWYQAWIHTFQVLGDSESARELSAVVTEEVAHRDALQSGLNQLVERGARGELAEPADEK